MKYVIICALLTLIVPAVAQQKTPASPATSKNKSMLTGTFSGISAASITLQNNAADDLAIVAKKETGKTYSVNEFSFPAALADDSKYKVTIKKSPKGLTTAVYAGSSGTMPQKSEKVRVGSDYTYDLISRNVGDNTFATFYECQDPVIAGGPGEEGRYVAYVSVAAGIAGSSGKHRQIFWRDRNAGTVKIISASPKGEQGNGDSFLPAMSADGKSIVFESYASNLIDQDGNGVRDIFLWEASTNSIKRVSVAEGGQEPNAESYEPAISGDGKFIAFTSTASNISATGKGTSNNNVFLFDIQQGTTTMISIDPLARKGGGGSNPSLSYDGSRIAFYSHSGSLTATDKNGLWDIFLYDKNVAGVKRISYTADGKERNQGQESVNRVIWPTISGNGNFITFCTTATNMIEGDDNIFQDVFVYDVAADKTLIASKTATAAGNGDSPIGQGEKIPISYNGEWLAFTTKTTNLGVTASNIVLHNMITGTNKPITAETGVNIARPAMSQNGSYIVFGIGAKLDSRFAASGLFASYTGLGPTRFGPQ